MKENRIYSFKEKQSFSHGTREEADMATIRAYFGDSCLLVKPAATMAEQKSGIDYIVTLRHGATVKIDAKAREKGASTYWRRKSDPEFALETWSQKDVQIGWTLSESSQTDLVMFTFDPSDCPFCYFIGFQALRIAFTRNRRYWELRYKRAQQQSSNITSWQGECIFVPASMVLEAVIREMSTHYCYPTGGAAELDLGATDRDILFTETPEAEEP